MDVIDATNIRGVSPPISIIVIVGVALFSVCKEISNNSMFMDFMNPERRVSEQIRHLKELERDDPESRFTCQRRLLEQDLRVRYSRDQFRRYLGYEFKAETSRTSKDKKHENVYRMRGSTLMYASFLEWLFISLSALAMAGVVDSTKPLGTLPVATHSHFSFYCVGCGMLLFDFLLLIAIRHLWDRRLCKYAFGRYVLPALDEDTKRILRGDFGQPKDPDYRKAVEEFRTEMTRVENKQTVFPMVTGGLLGICIPVEMASLYLQAVGHTGSAIFFACAGMSALLVGFVMFFVFSINYSNKIPPEMPIRPPDVPGLVDEQTDEVAADAGADGGHETGDQGVRVGRGPRP